jgi:hypothetical protein
MTRYRIYVELDDEQRRALDWYYNAPPGLRIAKNSVSSVLKGLLECDLGEILIKYRAALQRAD